MCLWLEARPWCGEAPRYVDLGMVVEISKGITLSQSTPSYALQIHAAGAAHSSKDLRPPCFQEPSSPI